MRADNASDPAGRRSNPAGGDALQADPVDDDGAASPPGTAEPEPGPDAGRASDPIAGPPASRRSPDELIAEYDEERPARRLSPRLDRVVVALCFLTSVFVLWQVFAPLQRGNQYYLILFLAAVLPLVFVCYRPTGRPPEERGGSDDPDSTGHWPASRYSWRSIRCCRSVSAMRAAGSTRSSTGRDR
jgi:hypothetical protein